MISYRFHLKAVLRKRGLAVREFAHCLYFVYAHMLQKSGGSNTSLFLLLFCNTSRSLAKKLNASSNCKKSLLYSREVSLRY